MLIIIFKPDKPVYNTSKSFCSIVLLNTLRKLIEKSISERLQIYFITSNFVHLNSLGGIKQCSTTDINLYLTHLIYIAWIKELYTSILAFDISQFFPSLNYQLLSKILNKTRFNLKITTFFSSYLINRQIQYI